MVNNDLHICIEKEDVNAPSFLLLVDAGSSGETEVPGG